METVLLFFSLISLILCLIYLGIISFFIFGWAKTKPFVATPITHFPFLSIIIPIRNEELHIGKLLEDLRKQSYPIQNFEVIVINDHSTDNTAQILEVSTLPNLKVITLNEKQKLNSYKKKAITDAIHLAKGELIVSTDGDCRVGPLWLSTIVSFYQSKNLKFISAPVAFHEEKSVFEKLQSLEFAFLQGVGAASMYNDFPNTCNGANLAYTKEVFMELEGFKDIDDIASGDDELFLHKVAEKYPTQISFLKNKDAIVKTHAKANLKEFASQRKRWASKSLKYKDKRITNLVICVFLFNAALALNLIAGIFSLFHLKLFLLLFILKGLFDGFFIFKIVDFYNKKNFAKYIPIVLPAYTLYILTIGLKGSMGGSYDWKGREVK